MKRDSTNLVFGGSGFIGLSLVRQLQKYGYSSVVIADVKEPSPQHTGTADYYQCDITNRDAVADLVGNVLPNVVFNLAGFANLDSAVKQPKRAFDLNVIGNINLLDAAVKEGVELFVYASSAYAMSDKGSFYGISKLASEKVVEEYHRKYDLDYILLRYGSIYAAQDFENNYLYNLVREALSTGIINHSGDGSEIREYVHVKDVSGLSVEVMQNRQFWNSALMLTGNERLSRRELFDMIREISGRGDLEVVYSKGPDNNHYKLTPYSFQGTAARKITRNPHYDMGQGILECINEFMRLNLKGGIDE